MKDLYTTIRKQKERIKFVNKMYSQKRIRLKTKIFNVQDAMKIIDGTKMKIYSKR